MDTITYLQHTFFLTFTTGLLDSRHFAHAQDTPLRILEVGCGTGEFAHLLKHHYKDKIELTAVDPKGQDQPGVNVVREKFLEWNSEGQYDVVLFTKSLHHCDFLEKTIQRAYDYLVPGGLLLAEELQPENVDDTTVLWFFDRLDLLNTTGCLHSDHIVMDATRPALDRWNIMAKARAASCHSTQTIKDAILSVFGKTKILEHMPMMHYHLPQLKLEDSAVGRSVMTELMAQEDRALANKSITAFGYTVVAEK